MMLPVSALIVTGILLAAAAYLLGSLPFSLWIGRIFFNTDVREHGSGNAGATNTWRVLGWKAGLPVLLLDVSKGFAATFLPFSVSSLAVDPQLFLWLRILCGAAAAAGHIYPVWAGFKGGKAVATLLGVVMGLMYLPALAALGIFILVFLLSRIVSLGSIIAALSLPVLVLILSGRTGQLLVFSLLISLIILYTHRQNIGRLLRGEEKRITSGKKGQ